MDFPTYRLHVAGGVFKVKAKLGDSIIPAHTTETLQAPRAVTAHLLLPQTGRWTVTTSHIAGDNAAADTKPVVVASQAVEVEEGTADTSCCRLSGFWPMQGAIVDVAAGFTIQVGHWHLKVLLWCIAQNLQAQMQQARLSTCPLLSSSPKSPSSLSQLPDTACNFCLLLLLPP